MKKVIIILSVVIAITLVGVGIVSVFFFVKYNQWDSFNKKIEKEKFLVRQKESQIEELNKKQKEYEKEKNELELIIDKKNKKQRKNYQTLEKIEQAENKAEQKEKKEEEDAVNEKIKVALDIPEEATCKIDIGEKYYWDGAGIYLIPVNVEGTGKYKGYYATGNFTEDYSEAATHIIPWSKS